MNFARKSRRDTLRTTSGFRYSSIEGIADWSLNRRLSLGQDGAEK
jgi:hypothetical protein